MGSAGSSVQVELWEWTGCLYEHFLACDLESADGSVTAVPYYVTKPKEHEKYTNQAVNYAVHVGLNILPQEFNDV